MSSTIIHNTSIEPCALPFPFSGVLAGGQRIKLNISVATAIAAFGGATALGGFQVAEALDDATPFNTEFMGAVLLGVPGLLTKYQLAGQGTAHMKIALRSLGALVALTGGASQGDANTRAEALRTACLAHGAGVGTTFVDGEHLAADTGNDATLAAIPAATTLGTCITVINGLLTWLNAHADQAGVHFNDDTTTYTITVDPPVTLANCITDLNDMLTNLLVHFNLGQPPVNA